MFEYETLDNIVPSGMADFIESRVMSNGFWAFNDMTSSVEDNYDKNDGNIVESFQFVNLFFSEQESVYNQLFTEIAQPIIWFLENKTGIQIQNIVRIKSNLMVPNGTKENNYNSPHVDFGGDNAISMVYYVNDSDGDTRVFDKFMLEGHNDLSMIYSSTPKKGSALIFPSNRFHASSNPIKAKKRCIINFVLQPEPSTYENYIKQRTQL